MHLTIAPWFAKETLADIQSISSHLHATTSLKEQIDVLSSYSHGTRGFRCREDGKVHNDLLFFAVASWVPSKCTWQCFGTILPPPSISTTTRTIRAKLQPCPPASASSPVALSPVPVTGGLMASSCWIMPDTEASCECFSTRACVGDTATILSSPGPPPPTAGNSHHALSNVNVPPKDIYILVRILCIVISLVTETFNRAEGRHQHRGSKPSAFSVWWCL